MTPNLPIEGLISNPDAMAEHVGAGVGLSSLLGGEIGEGYRPTASPFYSIAKKAMIEDDPMVATIRDTVKLGASTLKNIEKGTSHLFGYGAAPDIEDKSDTKLHELYDRTNELGISPDILLDHIAKQTAPLAEHAPDVTIGLSKIANNAMGILQTIKPNLLPGAPLDQPREPTGDQISKFNDAAKLLDNPLLLMKKMADGTLTQAHVDLVKATYPTVLESIKQSAMEKLIQHKADEKEPLSSNMRLSLSKLLGQYMDSSQKNLAQNQIVFSGMGMAKQQQQMPATQPSKSGMGKMNVATQEKTRAQQSSERKAS